MVTHSASVLAAAAGCCSASEKLTLFLRRLDASLSDPDGASAPSSVSESTSAHRGRLVPCGCSSQRILFGAFAIWVMRLPSLASWAASFATSFCTAAKP